MTQSPTLYIGWDVHKDSIAVAYAPQDDGAEVISLGAVGTRQCDSDTLVRQLPSQAQHRVCGSDAGPCGSWRYRYWTKQGDACWGVAPALRPKKAGDRVKTDRREALQRARLMRTGDRTPVYVPQGEDEASRALTRARAEARSALKDAKFRRKAFGLRHEIRSTGQATWNPAPRRGLSAVVCPPPAQHLVLQA
jgi:transposase